MKRYEKPVVTVDAGLAEGVYAASGAGSGVSAGGLDVTADWSGNGGQAKFMLNLSNANPSQLKVIVTFDRDIVNGWGGGASATASGNRLTLTWYSAPDQAEIYVQANGDIKQLRITGCSVSNS